MTDQITKLKIPEVLFRDYGADDFGYCFACGSWNYEVPDRNAERVRCSTCRKAQVYGIDRIEELGLVQFVPLVCLPKVADLGDGLVLFADTSGGYYLCSKGEHYPDRPLAWARRINRNRTITLDADGDVRLYFTQHDLNQHPKVVRDRDDWCINSKQFERLCKYVPLRVVPGKELKRLMRILSKAQSVAR